MKKIILSALAAASVLGATSCKDFITENPISNVGPAQVTDANAYVNGALNTLVSDNMFRYGQFPNLWDYDSDDSTGPSWAFGDIGAGKQHPPVGRLHGGKVRRKIARAVHGPGFTGQRVIHPVVAGHGKHLGLRHQAR